MWQEFKTFAMRGNVIDMAVGIILGAAFGKIVSSMVSDILMPPLGLIFGGVDFDSLFINLGPQSYSSIEEAKAAGAATINYGTFIQTIVEFLLVAFAVFLLIKQVNRFFPKPAPVPATKECPFCFSAVAEKATRCMFCTSELPR